MDEAAVKQVNTALDKVRQQIENLERRAVVQNKVGEETARLQAEWAQTQIDLDTEHAKLFANATEILNKSSAENQTKLKKLAAADEENNRQREADSAEIAEIRDAIAELRKTLAVIPEEKNEAERSVLTAKSKLEHRLNSTLTVFPPPISFVQLESGPPRLDYLPVYLPFFSLSCVHLQPTESIFQNWSELDEKLIERYKSSARRSHDTSAHLA
jgi:hypothetical protein